MQKSLFFLDAIIFGKNCEMYIYLHMYILVMLIILSVIVIHKETMFFTASLQYKKVHQAQQIDNLY